MTLLGIGVLIFSIAFAVLVGYIARSLYALTKVIDGVGQTVEQLPDQLDNVFKETSNVIHESNKALADVNEKMHALNPMFDAVEDVGEATHRFTSSLAEKRQKKEQEKANGERSKKDFLRSLFKRRNKA